MSNYYPNKQRHLRRVHVRVRQRPSRGAVRRRQLAVRLRLDAVEPGGGLPIPLRLVRGRRQPRRHVRAGPVPDRDHGQVGLHARRRLFVPGRLSVLFLTARGLLLA